MSNNTKVVDGVVVTNTDVAPPRDWTNVYDEIGGDMRWNDDLDDMVRDRGIDGNVKPLYGTCSYMGEALYLMEVGDQSFVLWNALDDSIYRVNGNISLENIVASLDEGGLSGLDLEEL
ncbi:hypothetical protein FPSE_10069 [Fusarium pseudograminearum CS3096]|uniref:Uncharacterized protein n=1 Tax=Fusarium pseudograminearum (strain CS3096) TaxID=1028729 RepID=K3VBR7_FUSPC|nr:hypothetical protein FPSE_10069 [Fusarium pseudograminearum CS3096]EKJ69753.1 hypothetical protein FPSE_10069 [Fusarium pseudograminearum CS3096]